MHRINAIAAIGEKTRALGKDNNLIWDIPADLERFRDLTRGHPVIMGRKTWESIPAERRPLPKRANIIVTSNPTYDASGAIIVPSVEAAIAAAKQAEGADEIFLIGGHGIFKEGMQHTDRLVLTLVKDDTPGDVTFPVYEEFTKVVEEEDHPEHAPPFTYVTLERP